MVRIQSRVNFPLDDVEEARAILEPLGIKPETRPRVNIQSAILFVDQPEYEQLTSVLTHRGIHYTELKDLVFSSEELNNARFLEMKPAGYWGYPQPEDGFKDESFDPTQQCTSCGRGLLQNRPLLVKGTPRLGRNDILALNWVFEFVVTQRLRDLIVEKGLTGAEFWNLVDYRSRTPIGGFYQLHVNGRLRPMSTSTEFEVIEDSHRKKCPHPILNLRLHQMKYSEEDLASAEDFNKTCEWLGGGWFGQTQWTVVSARVFQLFRMHNIKKVGFRPVMIEK